MLDNLKNDTGKPDASDIQELREGLRKDLFAFLLEIEAIMSFAAERRATRSNANGLQQK